MVNRIAIVPYINQALAAAFGAKTVLDGEIVVPWSSMRAARLDIDRRGRLLRDRLLRDPLRKMKAGGGPRNVNLSVLAAQRRVLGHRLFLGH